MRQLLIASLCVLFTGAVAWADWDPGDPYKMHYPQMPNPNGWDVSFMNGPLGDDWRCTETGPVNDIHLWVSFRGGATPSPEAVVHGFVEIWSNVPAGYDMPWSHPGEPLWGMPIDTMMPNVKMRPYGTGEQGWLEPPDIYYPFDHFEYYQINIDPINDPDMGMIPFKQEVGEIYWLVAHLFADDPVGEPLEIGWKTSIEHFMDDAVYAAPFIPEMWQPLKDPITNETLDLAFVITPEPTTMAMLVLGGVAILRRKRQ